MASYTDEMAKDSYILHKSFAKFAQHTPDEITYEGRESRILSSGYALCILKLHFTYYIFSLE